MAAIGKVVERLLKQLGGLERYERDHRTVDHYGPRPIADGSVTYAKIQNMTSKRLLGRYSAGAGVVEELNLDYGTYTPTLTNIANLTSSTPAVCSWQRVGDIVVVSGSFTVDALIGGLTSLRMTLPVASNFTSITDASGAGSGVIAESHAAYADDVNDEVIFRWTSASTASHVVYFMFMYIVR
jgi:hypothetical protein